MSNVIEKNTSESTFLSLHTEDPLELCYSQLLAEIDENIHREGLINTPRRAATAFRFLTQGYKQTIDDILNEAIFESDMDEMIVVKDIEFYSLCEHHLLPFMGKCHIAYLPDGKIIGLSKIARLVNLYARRLQVQEVLTKQIAHSLLDITGAKGVGVVIEAQHLCMMMRGIEKQNATMKTSLLLGLLKKNKTLRSEFFTAIG
jgi:GTP cyclohydrolase I